MQTPATLIGNGKRNKEAIVKQGNHILEDRVAEWIRQPTLDLGLAGSSPVTVDSFEPNAICLGNVCLRPFAYKSCDRGINLYNQ